MKKLITPVITAVCVLGAWTFLVVSPEHTPAVPTHLQAPTCASQAYVRCVR